ncbi:MAG: D-aminoacyl-tRNA deacylase [Oscillospiraceae bacterium]|nr:D-aminoacyl-tRNA deacylase [Oscillospiraceae bacterium]
MRVILQRVKSAAVTIGGGETRGIGPGLFALFCAVEGDALPLAAKLAEKTAKLRIFEDAGGKMNLSAGELGLSALVVSNFTLAADTKKGLRPSFIAAAKPPFAEAAYDAYVGALRACALKEVKTGEFGADMRIAADCDGPVTILLDTEDWKR